MKINNQVNCEITFQEHYKNVQLIILKHMYWGWRDSSVVQGTYCSYRRPRFDFQDPQDDFQPY